MYRYHFPKILINKKHQIRWGIMFGSLFKSMSDKIHYVNLMPNQPLNGLKVGNYPYFARLLRKIVRGRGIHRGGTKTSLNHTKSLINSIFEAISGKGEHSRLCKLETVLRVVRPLGGRVGTEVRSLLIPGSIYYV